MNKIKNNIFYLFEQFLIIIPFFITIYATKQYGEKVYADILFLVSIITSLYIFTDTVSSKPLLYLKNIINESKLIKIVFLTNFIGFLITFLVVTFLAFYFKGIYLYLLLLTPMLFTMCFNFIRYMFMNTKEGHIISFLFISSAVICSLMKFFAAYYTLDMFYFLLSFVFENIIWASYLIYFFNKQNILKEEVSFSDIKIVFDSSFSFFIKSLFDRLFSLITITFTYILFQAELLIILLLAQRFNYAHGLFMLTIDNIFVSARNFKSTRSYLLKLLLLSIICIISICVVLQYAINPLLGSKFNDLSRVYLMIAPLAFINSIGFYLTQVKLEFNAKRSFILAAIISFLIGSLSLFLVKTIEDLIIVFYVQSVSYYLILMLVKK